MKEVSNSLIYNHKSRPLANAIHVQESSRKKDDNSTVVIFFRRISQYVYDFKCAVIKGYARITQYLSWFALWPMLKFFYQIKYHDRKNLKGIKPPVIIIANHQKFYDAFLIRLALGFHSRLLPMRFMADMKFQDPFLKMVKKTGLIHFLYATTGVFTVEKGLGLNKNLKRAKAILKNKGVVAMFPEGRLNRTKELLQFKRGVSALALSSNTPILPVVIKIGEHGTRNILGMRRRKIDIKIGIHKKLETHSTYEELAEQLRTDVHEILSSIE
ncbi:MAG: 1-acyl-sn-glycerol-3-phosphate acyltransferase [Candidatus Taylorbacteria bacterium]|nr:1-acyl-sn-glycerol-3-phosphate acyltransferase [Candidatus Taylorbacteria bacterium]